MFGRSRSVERTSRTGSIDNEIDYGSCSVGVTLPNWSTDDECTVWGSWGLGVLKSVSQSSYLRNPLDITPSPSRGTITLETPLGPSVSNDPLLPSDRKEPKALGSSNTPWTLYS